jgi:uncharacterized protein
MLKQVTHRPWPMPDVTWVMTQTWTDLLFAHWPVPTDIVRARVPRAIELDTWEGQTWLGIVPFVMRRVFPRGLFPVPWVSTFVELNVRTYVTVDGKPGVFFFSLDAANPLAVSIARRSFHLPYYNARMRLERDGHARKFESVRTHRGAPAAEFRARYGPTGEVYYSRPGTMEAWLTERYCLYTVGPGGRVLRGDIHHAPWPLQPAEAEIEYNSLVRPAGITLPDAGLKPALLHYSESIETVEWGLKPTLG